ncbi:hypothetical protein Hypma_012121 [Hypsizygus marmoreus]|uniref:Uncharacterized protein n=1 Tax=Hypsizygus marmoreus TaxID=39966 RepID=A0A369JP90_HYPMA|nr:hypothetical protein Hypma_012121 [Hypsizygus marmoreus]
MQHFTFASKNMLNSVIQSDTDHTPYYTTHTTSGFRGRKVTTITGPAPAQQISGTIHWRTGIFDVGGVQRSTAEVKRKLGGLFDGDREWKWSGHTYVVTSIGGQWVATQPSHQTPSAVLRLSSDSPITVSFAPDVAIEDTFFLLMIFIYSETKEEDIRTKLERRNC